MSRSVLVWPVPLVLAVCALVVAQPPSGTGSRPMLGVAVTPNGDDEGVLVREVMAGSPAAKAGLKKGDIITKLNGKAIPEVTEFLRDIGGMKPGTPVALQVRRGNENLALKALLGQASANETESPPSNGDQTVRRLEQRVEMLERRVRELEKQLDGTKKQ